MNFCILLINYVDCQNSTEKSNTENQTSEFYKDFIPTVKHTLLVVRPNCKWLDHTGRCREVI